MFPSHGKHKNCSGENAEMKERRRGSLAASRAFSDTYSQAHGRGAPQLHPASAQQHQERPNTRLFYLLTMRAFRSLRALPLAFSIHLSLLQKLISNARCTFTALTRSSRAPWDICWAVPGATSQLQHPQTCRQLHRVTLLVEILTLYL